MWISNAVPEAHTLPSQAQAWARASPGPLQPTLHKGHHVQGLGRQNDLVNVVYHCVGREGAVCNRSIRVQHGGRCLEGRWGGYCGHDHRDLAVRIKGHTDTRPRDPTVGRPVCRQGHASTQLQVSFVSALSLWIEEKQVIQTVVQYQASTALTAEPAHCSLCFLTLVRCAMALSQALLQQHALHCTLALLQQHALHSCSSMHWSSCTCALISAGKTCWQIHLRGVVGHDCTGAWPCLVHVHGIHWKDDMVMEHL